MFIEYFNKLVENNEREPILSYRQFMDLYSPLLRINKIVEGTDTSISLDDYKGVLYWDALVDRIGDVVDNTIQNWLNDSDIITLVQVSHTDSKKVVNIFIRDKDKTINKKGFSQIKNNLYANIPIVPKTGNYYHFENISNGTKRAKVLFKNDPIDSNAKYKQARIENVKIKHLKKNEEKCLCDSNGNPYSSTIVIFNFASID